MPAASFVMGLALIGVVACNDSSSPSNGTATARCDDVSSSSQAVVHAAVKQQPFVDAAVISHRVDGSIVDRSQTDDRGCATVASEPDALVTVVFATTDGVLLDVLTTVAPAVDELVVHGPHAQAPDNEPIAGQVTIEAGALPEFETLEANDLVIFSYDLGCTVNGCNRGDIATLPATLDVPSSAVVDHELVMTLSATRSGMRCCNSQGIPYLIRDTVLSNGRVNLATGHASIGSGFGHPCKCDPNGCVDCEPMGWLVEVNNELLEANAEDVNFGVSAEAECAGVWWPAKYWPNGGTGSPACPPDNGTPVIGCQVVGTPVGIAVDHVRLAYYHDSIGVDGVLKRQISSIRSDSGITMTPTDVLPEIPAPPLFQDPDRRVLSWPVASVDADVVGIHLVYARATWTIALPPSADHLTLPIDPALPTDPARQSMPFHGAQMYVDSDDLDDFAALLAAGIHLDLPGPLVVDQEFLNLERPIVPMPTGRLRITTTHSRALMASP